MRSLSEEGVVLSGIAIDRDPLRTSQATSAAFSRGERNGKELATKERLAVLPVAHECNRYLLVPFQLPP